jgi:hypothetical protein
MGAISCALKESLSSNELMKENVGRVDQSFRAVLGPALMVLGYSRLGGRFGSLKGLATLVAGATVIESAVTRVCPLNALFGVDTRKLDKKFGVQPPK